MNDQDLQNIKTAIKEEINSSEKRFDVKLVDLGHQLMADLADFMEKSLFPMIEEKANKKDLRNLATKDDIGRLERKVDHFSGKVMEHDLQLKKIISTPTVALELKN